MMVITCPYCGPRNETEYHYGGQAHVPFPAAEDELTDKDWAEYLFYRANTMGPYAERWMHAVGCRRWFNVVRDTIAAPRSRSQSTAGRIAAIAVTPSHRHCWPTG